VMVAAKLRDRVKRRPRAREGVPLPELQQRQQPGEARQRRRESDECFVGKEKHFGCPL